MIVYRLISTLKKQLRHTKSLYIHMVTNSHQRQKSICTLLPLDAIRKESNVSLSKFNKQQCSLVSKKKDLSLTKPNLIDLNAEFWKNHDYIYTDCLHHSENVVKAIVKSLRNNLMKLISEISDCAISIWPKHNRQTTRHRQNGVIHSSKL